MTENQREVHVCKLLSMFAAGVAVLCALSIAVSAQPEKKYKNQDEYEVYNVVAKDFAARNFAKALVDLASWSQKYPDSDFKDDRQLLYVQAYAAADQPAKAIDSAAALLSSNTDQLPGTPADIARLLYSVTAAIQHVPDPSSEQLGTADKAAHRLLTYDTMPQGVTAEAWPSLRTDLQTAAHAALLYIALVPIAKALKTDNCSAAEAASMHSLESYPESAQAAWYLASAELCLYKTHPEKAPSALYELARAAALDPVKGRVDPKWQQTIAAPTLEKIYKQYHGDDPQGLMQLKELALKSALPPPGFALKSATEIAQDKQAEFESKNPELALWMKIKDALSDQNGEQYFLSEMKDANVPQLYGVLVEAKPECRPRELLVAVRTPDASAALRPEITLKIDAPLQGKPDQNSAFRWEGVATAFTKNPFMLTIETEAAKITGLKTSPCAPAPAKRNATKRNR
jgi:hypothetical protein